MNRLISFLPSRLALAASLLGYAVVLAPLAPVSLIPAAHAEQLGPADPVIAPGKQARPTAADAEQARIQAVLHGERYPEDAENLAPSAGSFAESTIQRWYATHKPATVASVAPAN